MKHGLNSKSVYAQQMIDVAEFIEEVITSVSPSSKLVQDNSLISLFSDFKD